MQGARWGIQNSAKAKLPDTAIIAAVDGQHSLPFCVLIPMTLYVCSWQAPNVHGAMSDLVRYAIKRTSSRDAGMSVHDDPKRTLR